MPRHPKEKRRKRGRPKLAKNEAKAKIVPVRFAAGEVEQIAKAAGKANQTVSQWIRSTLNAAVEG
jgi:hypothetical protein